MLEVPGGIVGTVHESSVPWRGCSTGAWRIIPFSKWLVTKVIVSPLRIVLWDLFQMARLMAYKWGVTHYLLTGMILQVLPL